MNNLRIHVNIIVFAGTQMRRRLVISSEFLPELNHTNKSNHYSLVSDFKNNRNNKNKKNQRKIFDLNKIEGSGFSSVIIISIHVKNLSKKNNNNKK